MAAQRTRAAAGDPSGWVSSLCVSGIVFAHRFSVSTGVARSRLFRRSESCHRVSLGKRPLRQVAGDTRWQDSDLRNSRLRATPVETLKRCAKTIPETHNEETQPLGSPAAARLPRAAKLRLIQQLF